MATESTVQVERQALTAEQRTALLGVLQARFEAHMRRHPGLAWATVEARLAAQPATLWSLSEMERSGGEPDVVGQDAATGEVIFYDCSAESPEGRRNVVYDRKAQDERDRKGVHPAGNVLDMAAAMGIEVLTEEEYRALQTLGEFDTKTQSWVRTPPDIRKLGGAVFCDRRYGRVFLYHNSAPSFYGVRGFRGALRA